MIILLGCAPLSLPLEYTSHKICTSIEMWSTHWKCANSCRFVRVCVCVRVHVIEMKLNTDCCLLIISNWWWLDLVWRIVVCIVWIRNIFVGSMRCHSILFNSIFIPVERCVNNAHIHTLSFACKMGFRSTHLSIFHPLTIVMNGWHEEYSSCNGLYALAILDVLDFYLTPRTMPAKYVHYGLFCI